MSQAFLLTIFSLMPKLNMILFTLKNFGVKLSQFVIYVIVNLVFFMRLLIIPQFLYRSVLVFIICLIMIVQFNYYQIYINFDKVFIKLELLTLCVKQLQIIIQSTFTHVKGLLAMSYFMQSMKKNGFSLMILKYNLFQLQIESQQLLIVRLEMKSQLERILKSDMSEYKIAISEHITNLDQFEQCLTQRSIFMQNFNKMLKTQLEKIQMQKQGESPKITSELEYNYSFKCIKQVQSAPEQIKSDQMKQNNQIEQIVNQQVTKMKNIETALEETKKEQILQRQKQPSNQFQQSILNKVNNNSPYHHKQISIDTRNSSNACLSAHKLKLTILTVHQHFAKIRRSVYTQIQDTKNNLLKDMSLYIVNIVNKIDCIYQNKIKCLQQKICELNDQNLKLKKEKQQANIYGKSPQLNNVLMDHNKITMKTFQNQPEISFQNRLRQQKVYSPIWAFQLKQNNPISERYQQQSYAISTERKHRPEKQQSYYQSLSLLSYDKNQNSCLQQFQLKSEPRLQRQKEQMTIENTKNITWKHFTCNLQNINFEESKPYQTYNPSSNNQNVITSVIFSKHAETSVLCKKYNSEAIKQRQPNLPILLRKNTNDRHYDIPAVRALVVSYPPVQQGFSILRLGNQVVYKGMWKFRKFHGKGILNLSEYSYDGDFQYGLLHGRGTLKIGNLQYIGQFRQNKAQGQGRLKLGGINISGRWKNNSLVQKY